MPKPIPPPRKRHGPPSPPSSPLLFLLTAILSALSLTQQQHGAAPVTTWAFAPRIIAQTPPRARRFKHDANRFFLTRSTPLALNMVGDNPMDAGSGIYYDADPSRMNEAAAAAAAKAKAKASAKAAEGEAAAPTAPPSGTSTKSSPRSSTNGTPKDVLIIGSGLAGLSTAYHLSTTTSRHVTILERESHAAQLSKTTAGSFAAAGMLAPQSERLPTGPLLELCLESRDGYGDWCSGLEGWARNSGKEGRDYLWRDGDDDGGDGRGEGAKGDESKDGLKPWEVGYTAKGGFLAPAFAGDSVSTWAPPPPPPGRTQSGGTAQWLDATQVRELEPQLSKDVVGGWWFPEDASVDARRLTCSLRAACVGAGVQFMVGADCEVKSLELSGGTCHSVRLADGRTLTPKSVLVANGSWMRDLLPVPIVPHKGQSFSVRMPPDSPPLLSRVLFAQDTYIVPKADGRIVVGATVEAGSFDPNVTPAGLMHCVTNAVRLVPGLANLPLEETWAGLRPTTPDKGPILGRTPWSNLFIAGGYWRNGVLLAPKTGQLVGDLMVGATLTDRDEELLGAFGWDRFTKTGGGDKMAADARYAASMHPVHGRSEGVGVSAAVGTELGFYSGAGAAAEERARDRRAMFGSGDGGGGGDEGSASGGNANEEDAFERAAMMGKTDASAFSFGDGFGNDEGGGGGGKAASSPSSEESSSTSTIMGDEPHPLDGEEGNSELALKSLYDQYRSRIDDIRGEAERHGDLVKGEKIPNLQERKLAEEKAYLEAFTNLDLLKEAAEEEERRRVYPANVLRPPEEKQDQPETARSTTAAAQASESSASSDADYDETTFDGYQAILKDDWGASEADLKEKMRRARIQNRGKASAASAIDESKIGAVGAAPSDDYLDAPPVAAPDSFWEDADVGGTGSTYSDAAASSSSSSSSPPSSAEAPPASTDLSSVYAKIKANKVAAASDVEMEESVPDERPDPGFHIYRVDPVTRESRVVPPYTTFQAMEDLIASEAEEGQQSSPSPSTNNDDTSFSSRASQASSMSDNLSSLEPSADAGSSAAEVPEVPTEASSGEYNEETYDGYQAILKDDWGASEDELKEKMRIARISNRGKVSAINESAIGAVRAPEDLDELKAGIAKAEVGGKAKVKETTTSDTLLKLEQPDLSSLYEKIISNKAAASEGGVEMEETAPDERTDPGFRIYRIDPETRESFEIPPFTQPGAVEEMIAEAKKQQSEGPGVSNHTNSADPAT